MRFFHRGSHADREQAAAERQAQQERDQASLASIERGGLPLRAQERLTKRNDGATPLWGSTLSTPGFLAVKALRFEPLGQVLGASIYHIAYDVMSTGQWGDGEVTVYAQALYEARERALGRMRQEAVLLGAHGVIGVKVEQKAYEWGGSLLDFIATGTAVRLPGAPPLATPFLSDLSGQEALALLHAGYVPVDIAVGCGVYYIATTWDDEMMLHGWQNWSGWSNMEMSHFTSGVYQARRSSIAAMEMHAQRQGAEGVVGSNVALRTHAVSVTRRRPWDGEAVEMEDHVFEFTAIGTAVAAIGRDHEPPHARLVLNLGR